MKWKQQLPVTYCSTNIVSSPSFQWHVSKQCEPRIILQLFSKYSLHKSRIFSNIRCTKVGFFQLWSYAIYNSMYLRNFSSTFYLIIIFWDTSCPKTKSWVGSVICFKWLIWSLNNHTKWFTYFKYFDEGKYAKPLIGTWLASLSRNNISRIKKIYLHANVPRVSFLVFVGC